MKNSKQKQIDKINRLQIELDNVLAGDVVNLAVCKKELESLSESKYMASGLLIEIKDLSGKSKVKFMINCILGLMNSIGSSSLEIKNEFARLKNLTQDELEMEYLSAGFEFADYYNRKCFSKRGPRKRTVFKRLNVDLAEELNEYFNDRSFYFASEIIQHKFKNKKTLIVKRVTNE